MLVEFRVANFRSFREEQTLSLVASSDKSLPDNCIETEKFRLLRTTAVYGPNASGKSNLIKALDFMRDVVRESAKPRPPGMFRLSPFLLHSELRDKPSLFEVTIILNGVRYQYGFTISRERIHEEWLFAYPGSHSRKWFQRGLGSGEQETSWQWSAHFKGEKTRLSKLTRPDALFLSIGAQFNHEQLTPLYRWFSESLRTLPTPGSLRPVTAMMLLAASDSESHSSLREYVVDFLRDADLGIDDVSVSRRSVEEPDFLGALPDDERSALLKEMTEHLGHQVKTAHRSASGAKISFDLSDESDGTQRLFQLAGPWLEALLRGYVVFLDEIETSLHPLLVRELIRPFQNPEISNKGAQLVFTTHDTTLLDPELLRRDQVWFTEKDELGATTLRPLSDFKKARKGEAMQKGYLAGRYGAVPILKAFGV